jgi:SanA protein
MKMRPMTKKISMTLTIIIIGVIFLMIGARFFILHFSDGHIFYVQEDLHKTENCHNVMVLGAKVYSTGRMSGILRERMMTALDIHRAHNVCTIILSGNGLADSNGENEVVAMRYFLIENGVDPAIILEDPDGFDTFHSMKNVHHVFGLKNVLIITQDFHQHRAIFIARVLGIDAQGFVAYKYPYRSSWERMRNILREFPAAVKAIYEVSIYRAK